MVSSQAQRDQVALAMERGHSQRQACELIELPRSILKYRSRRAERDAPALDAMRRIAATYPRYGYRRVRIFLRREGHLMSPERAYRLWRPGHMCAVSCHGSSYFGEACDKPSGFLGRAGSSRHCAA